MATRKTKTTAKKKNTKTATTKTTATKTTKTAAKPKRKVTPRVAAKNKTAQKRLAKKTAIKTAAKKTAKKAAAKATAKKTATKTTAKTATKTAAKTAATKSPTLTTGSTAPNFTLPTDSGTLTLNQLRGKNVVLYFYPKDDTPGCTTEACGFRDNLPKFNTLNATVIGISKDDTASHKKFKTKYKLPFTLASDTTGEVCERYGVIGTKSMYGKSFTGLIRTTFLIDTTGTIRAIWRNVSVTGHVDTVAETLKSLGNSTSTTTTSSKGKTATKTTSKKKAA